jgi:hypothetical protein
MERDAQRTLPFSSSHMSGVQFHAETRWRQDISSAAPSMSSLGKGRPPNRWERGWPFSPASCMTS